MADSARMLLHWSPRSPYVRKVMIAAHALGLADRIDCVRTVVGGTTPNLALMTHNPLGKLPTLVVADGTILYDSFVILEYLDGISTAAKLIPADPAARLVALRQHALGNGMLDILLQWLAERARPAERQSADHIALWRGKIRAAVDALEAEAPALAAEQFTVGHLAIGVALGYLDFRFDGEAWRAGHPALAAWYDGFSRHPSVAANPPVDEPRQ